MIAFYTGAQSGGRRGFVSVIAYKSKKWIQTNRHSVKEDICEWQSVSWESGKRRMTVLWGEVSAPGGAGKRTVSPPLQWLPLSYTRKLSAIFQKDSLWLFHSISLYLSAYLPPLSPSTLFIYSVSPCSPFPGPPLLSLSATVKSDRLQVCFHCEGRIHCRCMPATSQHDTAPLPIYCAVIYPQTPYILKPHLCMQALWLSYLS